MEPTEKLAAQVVGNVGLYYVCYRLSRLGWNVMPTTRNARGIDVLIYNQDATRSFTIQVKALSKASPVPLGGTLDRLMGDFFIVCRKVRTDAPECFVLIPSEVKSLAHKGEKNGKTSYWLQPAQYSQERFRDAWSRIGYGAIPEVAVQQSRSCSHRLRQVWADPSCYYDRILHFRLLY